MKLVKILKDKGLKYAQFKILGNKIFRGLKPFLKFDMTF